MMLTMLVQPAIALESKEGMPTLTYIWLKLSKKGSYSHTEAKNAQHFTDDTSK